MDVALRAYEHARDYGRVGEFLLRTYRRGGEHVNWLQPRWEYMHFHPLIRGVDLTTIGIWEEDGEIAAVAHPEHPGSATYLEVDPKRPAAERLALKAAMLDHAEARLHDEASGGRMLRLHVNASDVDLQRVLAERGYVEEARGGEVMSSLDLGPDLPAPALPEGYSLVSLADDGDLRKTHRVLHRGFNHPGEPPEDELADRAFMRSAPNFRLDLNIVAVAPGGQFAAYAGLWHETRNGAAYVEPVATDPEHRRLGLAKAALLEGLRRCRAEGARVAYVGSDLPVYLALGFAPDYRTPRWARRW